MKWHSFLFWFCNYELLVLVCFFLFLFFAILSDKGQLGLYLQELSVDARTKITRHLVVRESMIRDLQSHLDRSVLKMKKLPTLYGTASKEILLRLGHIVKNVSYLHITTKIKYYLDVTVGHTQSLSLHIRLYMTNDLFVDVRRSRTSTSPSDKFRLSV